MFWLRNKKIKFRCTLLTKFMYSKDENLHSLISLCFPPEETLDLWLCNKSNLRFHRVTESDKSLCFRPEEISDPSLHIRHPLKTDGWLVSTPCFDSIGVH